MEALVVPVTLAGLGAHAVVRNSDFMRPRIIIIVCFHSLGQQLYKFVRRKKCDYIRKELVWNTNMAAVSLLLYINMAAVTSCENVSKLIYIIIK